MVVGLPNASRQMISWIVQAIFVLPLMILHLNHESVIIVLSAPNIYIQNSNKSK